MIVAGTRTDRVARKFVMRSKYVYDAYTDQHGNVYMVTERRWWMRVMRTVV
jgi:hypothetical protein